MELLAQETDKKLLAKRKHLESELQQALLRSDTISQTVQNLYEDNVSGKVFDEWFLQFANRYETERMTLKAKIASIRDELSAMGIPCRTSRERISDCAETVTASSTRTTSS